MSIKHLAIIISYGVICFVLSLAFVQCSAKNAQKQVSEARSEAESMRSALGISEAENRSLRENMAKYDGVLKQAISAIERAYESHVERVEKIHDLPDDWLQCELPSELQDLFAGYCDADGCSKTAIGAADSM